MDRFVSHYRLLECLGTGGAGEVFKAEDVRLGRIVALKLLDRPTDGMLEEARAAASVNHPNVATVYDVGEYDGRPYIALEYVDGETLASRLSRGTLDIADALDIAILVARALEAAHGAGFVHGDVTASNIALAADGSVKVLDFGLSRRVHTVAGAAGTPGYVAPEQLGSAPVDGRADLFSLGVVLYEMLAGARPFGRESWRRELFESEPPPLSRYREDAPLELERIVRRALERDRDTRYGTAAEFAADLERLRAAIDRESAHSPAHSHQDGSAFRGLLPFQEADRDRFFGRESETASLIAMVSHADFRFGVLYGDSGSGKTSLLRAGVIPALWEAGCSPVYVRSHAGPLEALVVEARRASGVARGETEPIASYLSRVVEALGAPLVVVLDQFEEFFVTIKTAAAREPFLDVLAALHADAALDVRFLVSMRSDFLYFLGSELADRVHEPLASSRLFHLRAFDEAAAARIVERSAERTQLPFEPGLSRHVARDLAVNGSVLPSELQIVGERLQTRRIFTVREYRRAGGKEVLVYSFLEDVIRASGDRDAAGLVLRSLVSDENTRLALEAGEITRRTQRDSRTVTRLLKLFVDARLVRELQDEQPYRYELVHEYLIDKINQVAGRVHDATQRANRLLRQYASSYAEDPRTRVPLGKLWFIRRFTDRAMGERERDLFRKSIRSGLTRTAALVVIVALVGVATAAAFSVEETWDGVRLSDGHSAAVRSAVFSPDGRLLVTCGEDNRAIVWDFARRQQLASLDGHTNWVTTVGFAPDGAFIATGSFDKTIAIWNTTSFERVATLVGHAFPITAVGFSPDSRWLVSLSGDTRDGAIVWRTDSWTVGHILPNEAIGWGNVAFTRAGLCVLHTAVWNIETGTAVESVGRYLEDRSWVGLSPDSARAVTIAGDGIVRFLDYSSRRQTVEYPAHHDHGRAIAYSPDGRLVASGAEDVVLWDAVAMKKLCRLPYTSIVWGLAFSPDNRWLVSTHGDGAVLIWDAAERERVANLNEHCAPVRGIAFSPDGQRIVTTSEDGSAIVWNLDSGRKEVTLVGHDTRVAGASFSPDGSQIATVDQSSNLIVWEAATGRLLAKWGLPPGSDWRAGYCVEFAPDGASIVTSSYVVDLMTGQYSADFSKPIQYRADYYAVTFIRERRRLVGVAPVNAIIDARSIDSWVLDSRAASTEGMSFVTISASPDGTTFATGDDQGRVELWDSETLSDLGLVGRHSARVKSVAFSPDGRTVASCGDDQMISIWDVRTRKQVATVGTHAAPVLAIAYSPDGRRLVAGGHDNSVRVYTRHRNLWGFNLD